MNHLRAFLTLLFLALAGLPGLAQDLNPALKAEQEAVKLRKDLDATAAQLALPSNGAGELTDIRAQIEAIRTGAFSAADLVTPPAADIDERLKQLGDKPEDGNEAPAISAERVRLEEAKARFQAAQKKLELLAIEAEQLSAKAATIQRDRFFQRVFESNRSIANPALWADGISAILLFLQRFVELVLDWWGEVVFAVGMQAVGLLALLTVGVTAVSLATRGWLMARMEPALDGKNPSNFDRLWRVAKRVIVNAAVAITAMAILLVSLNSAGVMTERFARVVRAVMDAWISFVVLRSFVIAILAPGKPEWRLPDLMDETAVRLSRIATVALLIFSLDLLMRRMFDVLFLPLQFSVAHSALVAGFLCFLLAAALGRMRAELAADAGNPRKADTRGRKAYFRWTGTIVQLLWIVVLVVVGALLTGYVALAHFMTTQVITTGALVSAFYLLHHLTDELIVTGLRRNSPVGRFLRQEMSLSEKGVERLSVIFGVMADFLLIFLGIPAVFLQWVVTWVDLQSWLTTAFFGVTIGGVTLSPSLLVTGLAVLVMGILITKALSSWLDRRVLARTEMDKGVRDSLRKGVGYTGYFLAMVVALSSAGLEFSNIAIVAGALGVGIGFGLQSIVNNFVSGLILLAERPVKIGDWVVLGPGEGFVKRINVRATEIETFDGASIIVPNSNLIQEPVKNWTHADTRGKYVIPIRVARDSDPAEVKELLLACLRGIQGVARDPEPWVLLNGFGDHGLEFQLNFFVEDIVLGVFIASEIRFAILRSFRDKGIVMPYPQRDVYQHVSTPEKPAKPRRPARRRK